MNTRTVYPKASCIPCGQAVISRPFCRSAIGLVCFLVNLAVGGSLHSSFHAGEIKRQAVFISVGTSQSPPSLEQISDALRFKRAIASTHGVLRLRGCGLSRSTLETPHPAHSNASMLCNPLASTSCGVAASTVGCSPEMRIHAASSSAGTKDAAVIAAAQSPPPPAAAAAAAGDLPAYSWDPAERVWWLPPERAAGDDGVEALAGHWDFSPRDCLAFRHARPDEWGHIPAGEGCLGALEQLCEVRRPARLPTALRN
jgi:hypothetical protein